MWRSLAVVGLCTARATAQHGDQAGEPQPPLPPAWVAVESPALTPQQTLESFTVGEGFTVQLVACEPMVVAPVAMAFHADGSLWVVQMPAFMSDIDGAHEEAPTGSIVRLRDRDGDGRMDERTVVLESLVLPRSIAFHERGVFVIEPPHLLFALDEDGDGRAESTTVVASGFAGIQSPEHAGNALTWCHDGSLVPSQHHAGFVPAHGGVVAFATPVEGQWGQAIDDFGRLFVTPNSDPLLVDLIPRWLAARTPGAPPVPGVPQRVVEDARTWPSHLTPGVNRAYRAGMLRDGKLVQVTAACGPVINRDIVLGEALRGDAFVCAPCANAVKRYALTEDARGIHGAPVPVGGEFLASASERFRPCDLKVGPDGALYIADFSRGILQHRIFMTSFLRSQVQARGLDQPIDQGRIWRVVPTGQPLRAASDLDAADDSQLLAHLSGPSGHLRDVAARLVVERCAGSPDAGRGTRVVARCRELALAVSVDPGVRHSAAMVLVRLGGADEALAIALTHDRDARLRADAASVVGAMLHAGTLPVPSCASLLGRLARDPSRATAQAALAFVGELPDQAFLAEIDRLAAEGVVLKQPPLRAALASGLKDRSLLLLDRAAHSWVVSAAEPTVDPRAPGVGEFLRTATEQVLSFADERLNQELLAVAARCATTSPGTSWAILDGVASWAKIPSRNARTIRMTAQPVGWGALVTHGPRALRATALLIDQHLVWPGRDGYAVAKAEPAVQDRGRLLYGLCVGCHQANGAGMPPVYPPLRNSSFVLGEPSRLIRILLHGLEGDLQIDGVTYRGIMSAALIHEDADLAALATWLRSQWGHGAPAVHADDVARVRAADAKRVGAWTVKALDAAEPVGAVKP